MTLQQLTPTRSTGSTHDEGIDGRRYVSALRRSWLLMLAIVVLITGAAIAISLTQAKTYTAEAQVIVTPDTTGVTGTDASAEQRTLATIQTLITSPSVLNAAGTRLDRTGVDLQSRVKSAVDPNANLITITAEDSTPRGASSVANAVARSFINSQAQASRDALARTQAELESQIRSLQTGAGAGSQSVQAQIRALQDRLATVSVTLTNSGSGLQVARAATPPTSATSPRPVRNAILALFVSLFLAVIAALARDQLRPVVRDRREVADVLDLPVLAVIPEKPGPRSLRRAPLAARIEQEAYRTLSASMRLQLRDGHEHVILITSALHAEGKTSAAIRLGRLLAESGRRTLVVSADLRWPRLDSNLHIEGQPGLSDLLAIAQTDHLDGRTVQAHILGMANRDADVLPAGTLLGDAAAPLLSSEAMEATFQAITDLGYTYVLVDAPPLLGLSDSQLLAQHCDHLLVVSRLRGLRLDHLVDLRATLDRMPTDPLGVVVIGGSTLVSPYYAARPTDVAEHPPQAQPSDEVLFDPYEPYKA